jgi:hypothetical protein
MRYYDKVLNRQPGWENQRVDMVDHGLVFYLLSECCPGGYILPVFELTSMSSRLFPRPPSISQVGTVDLQARKNTKSRLTGVQRRGLYRGLSLDRSMLI